MAKKRANGEGNIRKRADGRWEGRYTAGYNAETVSASSRMPWARRRRSARQSWLLLWRPQRASTSAVPTNTPWPRGCGAGTTSMLGHYDAGFTLRIYTHATRQKQDEAAQTMGSFMAQVM